MKNRSRPSVSRLMLLINRKCQTTSNECKYWGPFPVSFQGDARTRKEHRRNIKDQFGGNWGLQRTCFVSMQRLQKTQKTTLKIYVPNSPCVLKVPLTKNCTLQWKSSRQHDQAEPGSQAALTNTARTSIPIAKAI